MLAVEHLLAAAELETGVRGLADTGLLNRVGQLVTWINARGPYTGDQQRAMHRQLQRILAARLRIAGDRRRIPDIAREKVARPIFVIGFPRTGTTLLHSLLAEDPGVLAPRWWHSHEPSPPPGEGPIAAQRLARAERDLDRLIDRTPGLLTLHPYWDKGSNALIEDEELFTLDFRNAYPTLLYEIPALSVGTEINTGQARGAYRFHRELLQHLQWQSGATGWALKGVGHQFLLDELFEIYPDALCVWPHRDPVEVQASTLTIAAVIYDAITGGGTDWKQHARTWVEGIKAGLDRVITSALVADPRVVHLDFRELARNPIGAIRQVYDHAGLPVSDEFECRMRAWLADPANRTDRYGRYAYSYAPFGLEPEWVRELFTDYCKRFNLT